MKRLVKIGEYETGLKNNICDVPGVLVGHVTIMDDVNKTGVTAILPHSGNLFREKVVAASDVFNGFGKSIGLVQLDELGTIETPILLSNALSASKVANSLISYMLKDNKDIGVTTSTVNPLVLECNDGSINQTQNRVITENDVFDAINNASDDFLEGGVGAGTGMKCNGFKGGIGSSSRIIKIKDKEYVLGVLVNSNYGASNGSELIFNGRKLGGLIKDYNLAQEEDKGSIVIVIATNAPLDNRQLKRIAKRAELGVARTGSYGGNGSGDIMVAFSTENKVSHSPNYMEENVIRFSDSYLNTFFRATVDATEEAILNSMLHAKELRSYNGTLYKSLMEYRSLFEDLLEK
ncbi:MAG: P1 family peptidase [Bacilli bacterium]|nr:P1 family peptidase [Bacilli bacterium]